MHSQAPHKPENWQLDTLLVHGAPPAPGKRNRPANAPAHPPLVMSSGFFQDSAEEMEDIFAGRKEGYVYARLGNPTVNALEQRVAVACGVPQALALSSGMSAITLALLSVLRAGDAVLVGRQLFGGTYTLFDKTLRGLGIEPLFFDAGDLESARKLWNPRVRLMFVEAIANPSIIVPDFAALRSYCDESDLAFFVDATLIAPCALDVPALGADAVLISGTKFFTAASSAMGGFVLDTGRSAWPGVVWPTLLQERLKDYARDTDTPMMRCLRSRMMADIGPCQSPMNAFLMLEGMETLGLRWARQCENALAVARYLSEHSQVSSVAFPGLPSHPGHALCEKQFRGSAGTMMHFCLESREACFRALNRMRLINKMANLGDNRSLALHPASSIYGGMFPEEQRLVGVHDRMIRLSLGIEAREDILGDLEQALA